MRRFTLDKLVGLLMAGCVTIAFLWLAGCAQNCPQGQRDCVVSSPASIGGFIW